MQKQIPSSAVLTGFGLFWLGLWGSFFLLLSIRSAGLTEAAFNAKTALSWGVYFFACAHALVLALWTLLMAQMLSRMPRVWKRGKSLMPLQITGVVLAGFGHLLQWVPVMAAGDGLVLLIILILLFSWIAQKTPAKGI